jgi:hypothetical protein
MTTKRFVLGKFTGQIPENAQERAVRLAAVVLENAAVRKLTYNEAIAKGPRGDAFGFDFTVEAWLDGEAEFDPQAVSEAARHEGIDPDLSRTVLAEAYQIKHGSAAVKGTFLSKRRPDSSVEEYQAYWRKQHADIIQAQKDFFGHVRAYVQNHFIQGTFRTLTGTTLSQEDGFDGSPQMWFDTPDDIYAAFATNGYQQYIKADEQILVKVGYSQSFIAREHEIDIARLR